MFPQISDIFLSNLSFTTKLDARPGRHFSCCLEVRYCDPTQSALDSEYAEAKGFPANYFPEYHLSKWFSLTHGIDKQM